MNLSLLQLTQQQEDLKKTELAFKKQKQWMKKREEIEKIICQTEEIIKKNFYQNRQKKELPLESSIEEERKKLRLFKQHLIEIDQELDQIEEFTEKSLEQKSLELLHFIWDLYPERREKEKLKWEEWNDLRFLETDLLKVEENLEHFSCCLNRLIQTRQSIKGKGFFNYIIGLSPNIVIEQQLNTMQILNVNILSLTENILSIPTSLSLQNLLKNLSIWLIELQFNWRKTWNFRYLDTLFLQVQPSLQKFTEDLKKEQNQLKQQIERLNQEIQTWMENT